MSHHRMESCILSGPWHPSQGLLCVTSSPTTISSMTILEASWRAAQKMIGMDVFARIYLWHENMAPNFTHDHSISIASFFNHSLSITLFAPSPSWGSSSPNKLVFLDGQLRFAVVHWRIRREWSDGSYHCFRPWVTRQRLKIQLQATRWSFWSLLCVVCCVLFFVFSFMFFFFILFLLRCSHFLFFQLSLLFFSCLLFIGFPLIILFLACCCCCCYGCWWHIYLAVMPTVCCRFDRICKGQWTRRPKRTSSLVSLCFYHLPMATVLSHLWWLGCACCRSFAALRYFLGSAFFQFQTAYSSLVLRTDQIVSHLRVESDKCIFVQLDGTGNRPTENSWILYTLS